MMENRAGEEGREIEQEGSSVDESTFYDEPDEDRPPWLSRCIAIADRLFIVPMPVVIIAAPVIVCLMVWVFALGNERNPLSYVAYVIAAYLLIVICVALGRAVRSGRIQDAKRGFEGFLSTSSIMAAARRSDAVSRFVDEGEYRQRWFILGGLAIDILWAVVNLVTGIWGLSVWLVTLGVYYLLLALMRGLVLIFLRRDADGTSKASYRVVLSCGIMLVASTFVLSGIVTLVMVGEGTFAYGELLTYAVATFTFYSLINAIVCFIRLRRHENPLISANARINLAVALVSLFTLEIAMFSAFSTGNDAELRFVMPIITGAGIAIVLVAMGAYSIREARRNLHGWREH